MVVRAGWGGGRARSRAALTGEQVDAARRELRELPRGSDPVPDAAGAAQTELEALVLTALNTAFAPWDPVDGPLFGIERTEPRCDGMTLCTGPGHAVPVLEALLPRPHTPWGARAGTPSGIPGLRSSPEHFAAGTELSRVGHEGAIRVRVPVAELSAVREYLAGHRTTPGPPEPWGGQITRSEEALLPAEAPPADALPVDLARARSRVLRRLPVFGGLPAVDLLDAEGGVPGGDDFTARAAHRQAEVRAPFRDWGPGPRLTPRRNVLAVVAAHDAAGSGCTTVALSLAVAAAGQGERVLLVSTDERPGVESLLDGAPARRPGAGPAGRPGVLDVVVCRATELRRTLAARRPYDLVLLDAPPAGRQAVTDACDRWLGVVPLWPRPGDGNAAFRPRVRTADGRVLPTAPPERGAAAGPYRWAHVMRTHGWALTWDIAPKDPAGAFAGRDPARSAGIVLLGARSVPGGGTADLLANWPDAPPLRSSVPRRAARRGAVTGAWWGPAEQDPDASLRAVYEALATHLLPQRPRAAAR
ncbi:hypothetical protein [Streptomyces sp. NPDC054842]